MTRLFYDNRRLLALTIAIIAVAGLSSLVVLPRMEDPILTQRAAIVTTQLPGATPERVEALVTDIIEEELQEIPEVKELRSTSRASVSSIVIELRDDVYEAAEVWSRVRDKIDDAQPSLPDEAGEPQFDELEVTAYAQLIALDWRGGGRPNYAVLLRLAEELEQRLRAVPGTREIDTFGHPTEEVTVEIDPEALASLGLTPLDVARQVESSDAKAAAGLVRGEQESLLLELDSELDTAARIAATPLRSATETGGGSQPAAGSGAEARFATLGSIASVRKGIADPPRRLALVRGRPAVVLGALVRADQRIDLWHARATEEVSRFAAELPPAVGLTRVFEQSGYVQSRFDTLVWNLVLGAAAVMLVVWFMMGWRSAIAVGVALPLASLMVLAGMRWMGIPIHQMSVTGLIIALGLLIDNAIVMVDEVTDRIDRGDSPGTAVSSAVHRLAVPLFGSTFTTILSFAPIALMPGPAGEFVGAIALGVMLAVAASFFLAMTVTPAVAALLSPNGRPRGRRTRWSWTATGYNSATMAARYRAALGWLYARPRLAIALAVAPAMAGFVAATTLTEQFFPPAERDQFQVQADLPAGASIAATRTLAERATEVLRRDPRVVSVDWFLGESAPSFYYNLLANRSGVPQYAQAMVQLDRVEGYRDVIRRAQRELDAEVPEGRFLARQLEQGPPFEAPIEVRLFGPDLDRLQELGAIVRRVLSETPDVVHSTSDLSEALPKLEVRVDESQARLAGLGNLDVAEQLNGSLEGALGGTVLEATENLPVRVRVGGVDRGRLARIASSDLVGRGADGQALRTPLDAVAHVAIRSERSAIPRLNHERMNEVRAYITAGALPAAVQKDFLSRLEASDFELPPGYRLALGGEGAKRNDAVGNLMSSVAVLAVLMAATLVLSFGSFRQGLLIGVVAALSVGLALGSLAIGRYPFGFTAIIGAMGLVGVAINDSICVLVALREDLRARRGDPAATLDVVVHSTRHVLATTLTTVAGFLPLILGGGGFWPPMAVSIAGGVTGATVLALVMVPAVNLLLLGGCGPAESSAPAGERGAAPREHAAGQPRRGAAEAAPALVG